MRLKGRSIAVIGAGISGLACARELKDHGAEVTVLEKSRSLSGRCASRLWEGHVVDHGAQYFTIRDEGFRERIMETCAGVLRTLEAPVVPLGEAKPPGNEPRWYHVEGNNRLGRALAGELPVQFETFIDSLEAVASGVVVAGRKYDAAVSTAPWPQTALLLGDINTVGGGFAPCLTAFYEYEGMWLGRTQEVYARTNAKLPLAWSACENHKAGRVKGARTVMVVQASVEFSIKNLEADPSEWVPVLQDLLEEAWHLPKAKRLATFAHRWRFARCIEPVRFWNLPAGIFVSGDVCTASRVESAWLAGRATARQILGWFS
jgi:hypothetical protein